MRHGFTSFWLICGIIVCSLTGLFYLFLPNLLDELNIYISPGLIAITGIAMIVQVVGLILLLGCIANQKNGKTTWEQLD
jgi:hypothetical protein